MGTPTQWDYFTREELACSHCGELHMDNLFMDALVRIRKRCDFPLPITSGYRCPDHPIELKKGHTHGPHTTGKAVDVAITGEQAIIFLRHVLNYNITGIGINQSEHGGTKFIHIDQVRPRIWSY